MTNAGAGDQRNEQAQTQTLGCLTRMPVGHARKIFKGLGTRLRNELRADLRAMYNGLLCFETFPVGKISWLSWFQNGQVSRYQFRYTSVRNSRCKNVYRDAECPFLSPKWQSVTLLNFASWVFPQGMNLLAKLNLSWPSSWAVPLRRLVLLNVICNILSCWEFSEKRYRSRSQTWLSKLFEKINPLTN